MIVTESNVCTSGAFVRGAVGLQVASGDAISNDIRESMCMRFCARVFIGKSIALFVVGVLVGVAVFFDEGVFVGLCGCALLFWI